MATGCTDLESPPEKSEIRALEKADSAEDYCEIFDWYGDGECDDFCATPDPDCEECPSPDSPGVDYLSTDVLECASIFFACNDDEVLFSNDCGCGCIADTASQPAPIDECPDAAADDVHYTAESDLDPSICLAIDFSCEDDQELFSDECGCGCID